MTPELGRVRDVLRVTRVMTAGQAGRLSGLELSDLRQTGLTLMPVTVNLRHQQSSSRSQVLMVAARDLRARMRGTDLLHSCGALELALRTVPPEQFDPAALAMPVRQPGGEEPDLVYCMPDGAQFALEFDTGAYKKLALHGKLKRFTFQYHAVVYGTTIPGRQRDLTQAVLAGLSLGSGALSLHHVASVD